MYIHCKGLTRGKTKTASKLVTLTFRIKPGLKDAVSTTVKQEYRRIGNMVVVIIFWGGKIGGETTSGLLHRVGCLLKITKIDKKKESPSIPSHPAFR
jgi:hypothetical protein